MFHAGPLTLSETFISSLAFALTSENTRWQTVLVRWRPSPHSFVLLAEKCSFINFKTRWSSHDRRAASPHKYFRHVRWSRSSVTAPKWASNGFHRSVRSSYRSPVEPWRTCFLHLSSTKWTQREPGTGGTTWCFHQFDDQSLSSNSKNPPSLWPNCSWSSLKCLHFCHSVAGRAPLPGFAHSSRHVARKVC